MNFYKFTKFNISKHSRNVILAKRAEKANSVNNESITVGDTPKSVLNNIHTIHSAIEKIRAVPLTDIQKESKKIVFALKLNTKKDQIVRGIRETPGGASKIKRICVFTSPGFESLAKEAGADIVANKQVIEDIQNKKIDFDIAICTNDVLNQVKALGRILGPLNLMPNPKVGTAVSPDQLVQSIQGFKKGNAEFRSTKDGLISLSLGNYTFSNENILANLNAFLNELEAKRPDSIKGKLVIKAVLSISGTKGTYPIDLKNITLKEPSYFTNNKVQNKLI